MRYLGSFLILSLGLAGCASFSGKADYASYRLIRTAEDDASRARAQAEYVTNHPNGAWANQIRAIRVEEEDALYQANNATSEGLSLYLELYPEGQYVEQGRMRLAAIQQVEGRRQTERENQREAEREQRANAAEQRRTWATRAIGFWTQLLMGLEQWGQPIPEVAQQNAEFNRAFGREPRPRCSRSECIKFYRLEFAIPVPGRTRITREIRILLRLRMQEGRLYRVEMLLPDRGFSRWYELENQTFVTDMDPESRQAALGFALERLLPLIDGATSGAERVDIIPDPIEPPQVQDPSRAAAAPAAGGEAAEEGEEAAAEEAPMTFIVPIALEARRAGDLDVVVFSASPDDEGDAYDGLYLEYRPESEESEESEETE